MTGLFNLRTRLALGIAILISLALGTVYFLSNQLSTDLEKSGARSDLRVTEDRVVSAWTDQREALVGKLFEIAYDPVNMAQVRSGGSRDLVNRLIWTMGVSNAWMVDSSNTVVAEGKLSPQSASFAVAPEAGELAQAALLSGRADGVVTSKNKAAIVAAIRINELKPRHVLFVAKPIDETLARSITEVNGSQVAFVKFAAGSAVHMLGAQVSQELLAPLNQAISSVASVGVQTSADIQVQDRTGRLRLLHSTDDLNIYAAIVPSNGAVAGKIADFTRWVGVIAAVALAVALGAGLMFGSRLTKVLSDLTSAARQVGDGRFDVEVKGGGGDELGRYVESFNLLASSLKQRESKLMQSAHRDTVTGMPSRSLFENHLVEVVNSARSSSGNMALIMVVVDRLRDVNDSLGRKASDAMLSEIADRLRRALRSGESGGGLKAGFIARLATYEFGIIVPACDSQQASNVANKLADVITNRVEYEGHSVLPGGRIGVAVFPEHGIDPGSLLYSADIASTHAQSELSRIAVFDPSFETERENKLAMMTELRGALEQNELHIALLPKVGVQKPGALMAEALMRWEHPERGPQNPGEFVPFAEKTGFITQMTNWIINESLSVAADWMAKGIPLGVSVNLSPRDLGSPEFTTYVVERLRAHKLRGSALTLEVTEEAVMNASPVVKQNLDVLWRLGVRIAIDDFGAGYASLDQLRALPLSYLKVYRQHIRGLVNDDASRIVVKSVIDLGHSIGVEVVAEGVETAEQLEALRELGCDQAQGYFVGKPLPAGPEFENWVRDRSSSFGIKAAEFMDEAPVADVPVAAKSAAAAKSAEVLEAAPAEADQGLTLEQNEVAPLDFSKE